MGLLAKKGRRCSLVSKNGQMVIDEWMLNFDYATHAPVPLLQPNSLRQADGEGFEPPEPFGSVVFKTTAIVHSATHPTL